MWKNKNIAGKVLARLSEWTRVKEEEKRRRGPYPILQLCLGALLIFAAVVPENHLYRESGGQQAAQDSVVQVMRFENGETLESAVVQPKVETDPLNLNSHAAVLLDGDTGRILYGKNEKKVLPMASTTKIMTCILALENSGLDTEVEISDRAASMPEVKLHVRKGEKYRLEDLLYSLMLESHNDTAVAIAEAVGGSVENFADMMNGKAAELGCDDTYFLTPNGLDAEDKESGKIHSTTAADLARILRYCISLSPAKEEFLAITRAPSHAFSDLSGTRSFSCVNHNALLTSMEGAVSGKTGFTGKAGYCYVGAVKKGEKLFIAALLDCGWPPHRTYKWQDMRKLVRYGDKNFEYKEIEKTGLGEETAVLVENGVEFRVKVEIGTENADKNSLRVLLGNDEKVQVRTKIAKSLHAPVREGTPVGQRDYMVDGIVIDSDPVVTAGNVELWDFEYAEKI
ncbi:MAG: D-alanyl-D-alanine carboxypeptidase family protein, partial [Clostridiaceae bacterium]